jgi:hypothetical protein
MLRDYLARLSKSEDAAEVQAPTPCA